ncbi:MAG: SDR family oxidoreductase, partial [Pseudomonadota bacterium]
EEVGDAEVVLVVTRSGGFVRERRLVVHGHAHGQQIADTAEARGITEEEVVKDVMLEAQWTKKFVTAEQLAATALFLASEAAENITGAAIPVDGGWTAA